ncbi:uncharacterized protein LOC143037209 [Oratosquilla oratoria]|uniref:uncharacterized protein LOC143037209 n=1 Tax=Oratosquilla oratoria TaxID=337810 RepID=UPI003F777869
MNDDYSDFFDDTPREKTDIKSVKTISDIVPQDGLQSEEQGGTGIDKIGRRREQIGECSATRNTQKDSTADLKTGNNSKPTSEAIIDEIRYDSSVNNSNDNTYYTNRSQDSRTSSTLEEHNTSNCSSSSRSSSTDGIIGTAKERVTSVDTIHSSSHSSKPSDDSGESKSTATLDSSKGKRNSDQSDEYFSNNGRSTSNEGASLTSSHEYTIQQQKQNQQKYAWIEWYVSKYKLQVKERNKKIIQMKKESKEAAVTTEKEKETRKVTEENFKKWLSEKRQQEKIKSRELAKQKEKEKEKQSKEEEKKKNLQERAKRNYNEWTKTKQKKRDEDEKRKEEDRRARKEAAESRGQLSREAYDTWLCLHSSTPEISSPAFTDPYENNAKKERICRAWSEGRLVTFWDPTRPPNPTYVNPFPWVP